MDKSFAGATLPLYSPSTELLLAATRCDRAAMDLPSALPPPPHLDPDVVRANRILENGYRAAWDTLKIVNPDINQIRYHQERVWSELVPLLDAVSESTSDAAMRSWCCRVTEMIADLFNQLTQREVSSQHRSTVPSIS